MLQYIIGLGLIMGIGDVRAKKLIAYCGSAEAVFKEKKSHLLKIPGIGDILSKEILSQNVLKRAEEELTFIKKNEIKTLYYLDNDYPHRLKHCDDGPILLYYKGNAELNSPKVISIVGTRSATEYGKTMCRLLIEGLASYNVLVVSGLAYGIDTAAHKAALDNNLFTVGVLGHGLDTIYPAANRTLAVKMLNQGGLLTEYLSGTIPDKENFPKRNRIIAGMSDAVVVVEAAHRGGALITAEIGLSYNRDVMAVPGLVTSNYSKGCNRLIKQNKAALVESADDIIYTLGWENLKKTKPTQKALFQELSKEESVIVNILKEQTSTFIDEITFKSMLPVSRVATILLELEFKGMVNTLPGKRYTLVS
ncbi:MAG: DNA-processing protein DprA [Bacteroidales bacterium]|nr:DNA-processing protein DprA [Bacteroidales bacterium]